MSWLSAKSVAGLAEACVSVDAGAGGSSSIGRASAAICILASSFAGDSPSVPFSNSSRSGSSSFALAAASFSCWLSLGTINCLKSVPCSVHSRMMFVPGVPVPSMWAV